MTDGISKFCFLRSFHIDIPRTYTSLLNAMYIVGMLINVYCHFLLDLKPSNGIERESYHGLNIYLYDDLNEWIMYKCFSATYKSSLRTVCSVH